MELRTLEHLLQDAWATFPLNLFDVIILVSYIIYIYEEISYGVYEAFIHLCGIVAAFFFGIAVYSYTSSLLQNNLSFSKGAADALSFFIIVILIYVLVIKTLGVLKKHKGIENINKLTDRLGAFIFGSVSFFLIASFLATIILSLPISEYVKNQVRNSFSGKIFFSNSGYLEVKVKSIFGGAINETINFLTVAPASNSFINLHFKTTKLNVDPISREKMLILVNNAREESGAGALTFDPTLTLVATLHAKDMFKRGYFSHYTPDGFSPFDRLVAQNVEYGIAAENLAYAPDTLIAMNGLMKSPGHRENILNPRFKKIGIGVIDGKIYGKMFVQEFTD